MPAFRQFRFGMVLWAWVLLFLSPSSWVYMVGHAAPVSQDQGAGFRKTPDQVPDPHVVATKSIDWVDGTVFFNTRNQHLLDHALISGEPLSKESMVHHCGMKSHEIGGIRRVMNTLGGQVTRVSELKDWMHIRLPRSLLEASSTNNMNAYEVNGKTPRPCPFLAPSLNSLDKSLHGLVHQVAHSLQRAGMDELISLLLLYPREAEYREKSSGANNKSMPALKSNNGRRLEQTRTGDEASIKNSFSLPWLQGVNMYPLFVANESSAVKSSGILVHGMAIIAQCKGEKAPYVSGEDTGACLESLDFIFEPIQVGYPSINAKSRTVRFSNLTQFRRTCAEVPSVCKQFSGNPPDIHDKSFVYGIPLYKYVEPNMVYSPTMIGIMKSPDNSTEAVNYRLPPGMYNYFNATALTIREMYGVDPQLQGSKDTVQATTLSFGTWDTAVNVTSLNRYLSLLGLEPHAELEINTFEAVNNASVCIDDPSTCLETMSDVQTLQSFAPNATTIFTPDIGENSGGQEQLQLILSFFDNLLVAEPLRDVASISWSANYLAVESIGVLESYTKKLAALGMSILAATGDSGASGSGSACLDPEGADGALVAASPTSSWPVASPWVTAVGGTQLLRIDNQTTEAACMRSTDGYITSAGGFSGSWLNESTPDWQKPFVERYLRENNASTFSGFPTEQTVGWNPQGRGFPDLAAYAAGFPVLQANGDLVMVGGTSISAPMMAGLFTLANQKLISRGRKKIGYANPMLYWMAENCKEAFQDITVGNNQENEGGIPCLYGFPAAPGWDPVTGLGSIRFGPFVECVMKYQDRST